MADSHINMSAVNKPAISLAITILDYLHPVILITFYIGTVMNSFINLKKPSEKPVGSSRKRIALVLQFCLMISSLAQACYNLSKENGATSVNLPYLGKPVNISFLARPINMQVNVLDSKASEEKVPQHAVLHVLGITVDWLFIELGLVGEEKPLWMPYIGSWAINFAFEATLLGLSSALAPENPGKDLITAHKFPLAMNALRVLCSFGLLLVALFVWWDLRREEEKKDEESQPLLTAENAAVGENGTVNYGATQPTTEAAATETPTPETSSEDEDEPHDRNKEIKEKQRKRLEEEGGWLGYLRGFAIFLPYLWPRKDWKGQLCIFIIVVDIILDRFLNVMTPNELGNITNKLLAGESPWRNLGLYMLFTWLPSFAGWSYLRSIASTYVENYSYAAICDMAFGHVMGLSMDFHSNKDSGEVVRSVAQANSLNELVEYVLDTTPVFIDLIVAMWYVTHLFDIYLAFVVIMFGIIYVWSGVALTTWSSKKRRSYVEKSRNENKTVYECVSNWPTVTYFNRSDFERSRYGEAVHNTINAKWLYIARSWTGHAVQSAETTICYGLCLALAIWEISSGRKPIGNLVTFIMYWRTIISPLSSLANTYRWFIASLIDAERVLQLLQTKSSVIDKPDATELEFPTTGKVEFKNVHFHYDERKPVLKDISFTANPGETIAFVGETGGGKSTTLKLLFRFYDVISGSITVDGKDVRDLTLHSLRAVLGAVPQDPSLFNQTIMENIRYARLDASDEDIFTACKAAAIHDKILTFPDGYKSKVGERGVKLSGGELQRVAIARILLKNPSIVMLDEATSAVDSSTEQQIQEAFRKLSSGRTTFVVAHRLSTIVNADMILVIDKGEVIERGTHEELLLKAGKYFELWTKQTTVKSAVGTHNVSRAPSVVGEGDGPTVTAEGVKSDVAETDKKIEKAEEGDLVAITSNDLGSGNYTEEITKAFANTAPGSEADTVGEGSRPVPPAIVLTRPEDEVTGESSSGQKSKDGNE
jgi:ABC-type transport system involved in Fe-S cluster assembly fused permease/ATPase subunit